MKKYGFTLIELLVVISIIGILASLLLVSYQGTRKTARDGKRKADLEQIRSALEMYRVDKGGYPPYPYQSLGTQAAAGSDRIQWINNENYSSSHPLGALREGGYMAVVPYDPGLNTFTGGGWGACGGGQFYSYWSDGRTYKLAAVEETKGFSNCKTECDFSWGKYQYCVFNP